MWDRLRNWFAFRRSVRAQLDRIERLLGEIVKMHTGGMTAEEIQSVVDRLNRASSALEGASK